MCNNNNIKSRGWGDSNSHNSTYKVDALPIKPHPLHYFYIYYYYYGDGGIWTHDLYFYKCPLSRRMPSTTQPRPLIIILYFFIYI